MNWNDPEQVKKYHLIYYRENKEKIQTRYKEWVKENRNRYNEYFKNYRNDPEKLKKLRARTIANNKIKGHKNKNCSICDSNEKIEKHHPDYSKPLDVVYLCKFHHFESHQN